MTSVVLSKLSRMGELFTLISSCKNTGDGTSPLNRDKDVLVKFIEKVYEL